LLELPVANPSHKFTAELLLHRLIRVQNLVGVWISHVHHIVHSIENGQKLRSFESQCLFGSLALGDVLDMSDRIDGAAFRIE